MIQYPLPIRLCILKGKGYDNPRRDRAGGTHQPRLSTFHARNVFHYGNAKHCAVIPGHMNSIRSEIKRPHIQTTYPNVELRPE